MRTLDAPWWSAEQPVLFSEVPNVLPRRGGRPFSASSVYRWSTIGLHGVRLRRFKVGGSWATTAEELARWQAAVSAICGEEV